MCIEKGKDITVLNDVYNANPGSMKAAIDVLCYAKGRKVCILGDMFELGKQEAEYHREVGEYAAEKGIDLMLLTGELSRHTAKGAGKDAKYFKDPEELLEKLSELIEPGDTVLVKASRGMRLERTVEYLKSL